MKKVPKLYSIRQVAKLVGLKPQAIRMAIYNGRLLGAQKVDGRWVIQEDFRIKHHGIDSAGFDYLPPDLISEEPDKDYNADLPEFPSTSWEARNKIALPGFARVMDELGMTGIELKRQAKVHNATQARIRAGEKVMPSVAIRLSKALGIDVEEFLRP